MISAGYSAHVSDFTIRLGAATTVGRLVSATQAVQEPDFKTCTPDGRAVNQVYRDNENKVWATSDLARGLVDKEGVYTVYNPEAIKAAKVSTLPVNVLELAPYDPTDIDQHLMPSAHNSYVFEPIKKNKKVILPDDPKNIEWYNFIYSMLESNEIALVGKCTVKLKDNEGIYRLTLHKDNILLSRQVFPEDLREFDNFRSFEGRMEKVTPQFVEKATKIGKQAIKPFDPSSFQNERLQRLNALEPGSDFESAGPLDSSADEVDIMDLLDNFEL